jgi:hypothetical protein
MPGNAGDSWRLPNRMSHPAAQHFVMHASQQQGREARMSPRPLTPCKVSSPADSSKNIQVVWGGNRERLGDPTAAEPYPRINPSGERIRCNNPG